MWFLHRRRPQLDLAALERLVETIARAVALLEERLTEASRQAARRRAAELAVPAAREPAPPPPEPVRVPDPTPESPAQPEVPRETGFVLFVPTSAGYRLIATEGVTPERGERLRVDEQWFRVLRLGPSPLPADRRPCVFLEPQLDTLE